MGLRKKWRELKTYRKDVGYTSTVTPARLTEQSTRETEKEPSAERLRTRKKRRKGHVHVWID
jgi:hypothetical protein